MVRYVKILRNTWMFGMSRNIDDCINAYKERMELMQKWKDLGIELDFNSSIQDDRACFYTYDSKIAKQEKFEKEK